MVGEHRTPVFTHMMKYLIFRPFWNVPVDIAKKELVPHMQAKPGYLEAKNYEVINSKGEVQADYTLQQGGAWRAAGAGEAGAEELAGAGEVHVSEPVRHLSPLDAADLAV